jgi:hypothetical protein
MKIKFLYIFLSIAISASAQKNNDELHKAYNQIQNFKEVYFKFKIKNKNELNRLPGFISVDNRLGNIVKAYVPKPKFQDLLKLNIPFEVIEKTKNKSLDMATTVSQMQNWDKYPTYDVYVQMMQNFATNYPDITRLDTIGFSQNNRLILALKITDNPDIDENEPEFFYSAQMHGDELAGQVLMLRLIDYLLSNYSTDPEIANLINHIEIFINPLANPDGTYAGGNNTVLNATRYFNNYVDPNRNFPSSNDLHPDGESYAPETIDMMNFMDEHHFNLSANFHGGAEVVNYPWDEWDSATNAHADTDWLMLIATEYVNFVRNNSPAYYFTDVSSNGYTEGGDWYIVYGGRQDYMTYHKNGREITIELTGDKMPDAQDLPDYWNYNYLSFIHYIKQSLYGLNGIIYDSETSQPLEAKVEITGHDKDNSFVYSNLPVGNYYRYLKAGNYNVTYSKNGYYSQTINVNIQDFNSTTVNVALVPINSTIRIIDNNQMSIYPNPINKPETLHIKFKEKTTDFSMRMYDITGKLINKFYQKNISENQILDFEINHLIKGIYILKTQINNKNYTQKLIIK